MRTALHDLMAISWKGGVPFCFASDDNISLFVSPSCKSGHTSFQKEGLPRVLARADVCTNPDSKSSKLTFDKFEKRSRETTRKRLVHITA